MRCCRRWPRDWGAYSMGDSALRARGAIAEFLRRHHRQGNTRHKCGRPGRPAGARTRSCAWPNHARLPIRRSGQTPLADRVLRRVERRGQGHSRLQKSGPVRIGAIGLGVGTLATYARPGDVFRFYEINPEVVRMAKRVFHVPCRLPRQDRVVLGDARLSLESEPPQKFDLLVLDAFSGDAIPTHLLTREAFDIYQRHLARRRDRGPRFEQLPAIGAGGAAIGRALRDGGLADLRHWRWKPPAVSQRWVLATRNAAFLKANPSDPLDWGEDDLPAPLWTDQYSNLFQILVGWR